MGIKLLNASVDIFKIDGEETIIIRGILDTETLDEIKVGPYQREAIPGIRMKKLVEAMKTSTVPDVELGMRGDHYRVTAEKVKGEGDTFHLLDPVFVIDGLQRKTACKLAIIANPSLKPRIGAVIHVGTNPKWEAERFRILNQERLKLNSNILLRNARTTNPAVDMIYRLTEDPGFVLHNRVQWSQRKARTELTTALILCSVAGYLHSRFGPGRGSDMQAAANLDKTMEVVGRTTMRDNILTFFEVLEECFGVKCIAYSDRATVLRSSFLLCVAEIFTSHANFWKGNRLFVEKSLRAKIHGFPIGDPEVVRLSSSGGKAKEILYIMMLDHINSGKRTKRLVKVDGLPIKDDVANGSPQTITTPSTGDAGKKALTRMGI